MIASPSRRRGGASLARLALLLGLALGLAACQGRGTPNTRELLEPLSTLPALAPRERDLAAAQLAAAALLGDREESARRLAELRQAQRLDEEIERSFQRKSESNRPVPGPRARREARAPGKTERSLVPLAIDVYNSTLDDPRAYRDASSELLERTDLDPALRERLERAVADDPIALADRRTRDDWTKHFAYTFNAISAPIGRSLSTGFVMAPYQLVTSAMHYVAGLFEGDSVSVQERQALVHREQFLRLHPDAPNSPKVRAKVERTSEELEEQRRSKGLERAKIALANSRPYMARAMALQAEYRWPEYDAVKKMASRAHEGVKALEANRFRSLSSAAKAPIDLAANPELTRETAEALWVSTEEALSLAKRLARFEVHGRLDDEVAFIEALVRIEEGYEDASWRQIADVAARPSNMSRHARTLERNGFQYPYGDFLSEREEGNREQLRHDALGSFANGPRYKSLPRPIAYLIDLPAMVQTALMTPVRMLLGMAAPGPDFQRGTAVAAYRYLGRHPDGEHAREALDWLYDYEYGRENWPAALRLADFQPGFDPEERRELVERSASRQIEVAEKLRRRDERGSVLREVVRQFPDSAAGHNAGVQLRRELERAAPQRIRMTRDFLIENPRMAGPRGLGLRRELVDGTTRNGELHPEGVTFLGGRSLEFALVSESGDEDDPPERMRRDVSAERLARCIALLDETSIRNSRVDSDDVREPDSRRDYFFERARLGLTRKADARPSAESTYVFESMRERYGMVRGRDSILPVDLVVQGSVESMSLGAFPRWRPPKETPDAFLYR